MNDKMNRAYGAKKLVETALFTALCCILTMVIQIPTPTNGYVNLGDCGVLLSAWILGPAYGAVAAALGSAMADIFSGYAHYAPATFLIKGSMAVAAGMIAHASHAKGKKSALLFRWVGALFAEVVMVLGYFLYAALLLGNGFGAIASIPGNFIQGVFSIAAAMALSGSLLQISQFKR